MTLGDGIFWSTALILLAVASYQIFRHKKWKLVGKVFGALFLVGAVLGGGLWSWTVYQERPSPVQGLEGVRFGMTPAEVKVQKGEPTNEEADAVTQHEDGSYRMSRRYGDGPSDAD